VAGDFGRQLAYVPEKRSSPRLVAFLGGTIGNFEPGSRAPFLRSVAELMDGEDLFLMGTDLAGDASRIQPAYDDAAGVTAEFNLNLLRVLNRELEADFDLGAFAHVAIYDPEPPWVEMRLRSLVDQVVTVRALGLEVPFAEGEEMRTEISCKFTRRAVAEMYADAGLELVEWHEDPRGWFAVSTARRA
jgi:L-histidine N-alpha-methyltransferase